MDDDEEPCDFCSHPFKAHEDVDGGVCHDCQQQGEPRSSWQHQYEEAA